MIRENRFCPYCLISAKGTDKCGRCGQDTIGISHKARIPKKDAKKKAWKSLFEAFPHIQIVTPKTKKLTKLGLR